MARVSPVTGDTGAPQELVSTAAAVSHSQHLAASLANSDVSPPPPPLPLPNPLPFLTLPLSLTPPPSLSIPSPLSYLPPIPPSLFLPFPYVYPFTSRSFALPSLTFPLPFFLSLLPLPPPLPLTLPSSQLPLPYGLSNRLDLSQIIFNAASLLRYVVSCDGITSSVILRVV